MALCVMAVGGCRFDESGIGGSGGGDDAAPGAVDAAGPGTVDAAPGADVGPGSGGWYKAITIDGKDVAGALQDFPVYIDIDGDGDLENEASSGGEDIYFTDASGAVVLDHEIQRWERGAGKLEAWVKVPALMADVDTVIRLNYGGDAVAADPAGVWSNGFVAVWHLEQEPGGAGSIADSLGVRDATPSGSMDVGHLVGGTLGQALQFGGGPDEVTFANPLPGASSHTISAWVDQQTSADNEALVVLGTGDCTQARWLHSRYFGPISAGFYCDDMQNTTTDIQGDGPTLLHWTYVDATDDADRSLIYVDGVAEEGPYTHLGTQNTQGTVGRIGNAPSQFGTSMGLNGIVDEVRIANVARSAEWIETEHANQRQPANFYTVGPAQAKP